ncbi:apoptosis-associated speck-like protein containing a CARD isoform X2 [Scomber scombrus]|uniref:Apoptosis-associated speck-like protein containing a CARD isoform X2 n=1 Tax=Scomber scombrus TaxID=13677 RepID=A0AAV1NJE1_SCOSC
MLSDLKKQDFEKFCHRLLDRREEPRVRRNQVEGKSLLEITDVLVSTFTEQRALDVAVEILKQIGCNQAARELGYSVLSSIANHWTTGMSGYRHYVETKINKKANTSTLHNV